MEEQQQQQQQQQQVGDQEPHQQPQQQPVPPADNLQVPHHPDSGVETEGDQESNDSVMSSVSVGIEEDAPVAAEAAAQMQQNEEVAAPELVEVDPAPVPGPSSPHAADPASSAPSSTTAHMSTPNSTSSSVSDSTPATPEPPPGSSSGPSLQPCLSPPSSMLIPGPPPPVVTGTEDGYLGDCSSDGGNEKNFPVPPEKLEMLLCSNSSSRKVASGYSSDSNSMLDPSEQVEPPAGLAFQSLQPDLLSGCGYQIGGMEGKVRGVGGGCGRKMRSSVYRGVKSKLQHGVGGGGGHNHNSSWSHMKANIAGRKLRLAANVNNVEGLKRLLESGVDPNGTDQHRRTALHFSAAKGYSEVGSMCTIVNE